jgi:hypothetical protein
VTSGELELVVEKLLQEGVPSGVVARVFGLEEELIRQAVRQMRLKRYGTEDIAEYTDQLQWDAVEHAREILAHGTEADKMRLTNFTLGKHIALSGRRTPESQRRSQEELLDALRHMREGDSAVESDESEANLYVVRTEAD